MRWDRDAPERACSPDNTSILFDASPPGLLVTPSRGGSTASERGRADEPDHRLRARDRARGDRAPRRPGDLDRGRHEGAAARPASGPPCGRWTSGPGSATSHSWSLASSIPRARSSASTGPRAPAGRHDGAGRVRHGRVARRARGAARRLGARLDRGGVPVRRGGSPPRHPHRVAAAPRRLRRRDDVRDPAILRAGGSGRADAQRGGHPVAGAADRRPGHRDRRGARAGDAARADRRAGPRARRRGPGADGRRARGARARGTPLAGGGVSRRRAPRASPSSAPRAALPRSGRCSRRRRTGPRRGRGWP